jgi:hypothetical protein
MTDDEMTIKNINVLERSLDKIVDLLDKIED